MKNNIKNRIKKLLYQINPIKSQYLIIFVIQVLTTTECLIKKPLEFENLYCSQCCIINYIFSGIITLISIIFMVLKDPF